jgi:branched-chain amino acid transport system substrate-binding protein
MRGAEPDVLVIYGFPAPAATLTRQARQLGLTAKIIGSNATSNRTYPATVGPAAVGVMNVITLSALPEGKDPRMQEYVRKFTARFPELARQNRPDLGDWLRLITARWSSPRGCAEPDRTCRAKASSMRWKASGISRRASACRRPSGRTGAKGTFRPACWSSRLTCRAA